MHLRTILKDILKRTNSNYGSTRSSSNATLETERSLSDGAVLKKTRDMPKVGDDMAEGSVSGPVKARNQENHETMAERGHSTIGEGDEHEKNTNSSHEKHDKNNKNNSDEEYESNDAYEDAEDQDYYSLLSRSQTHTRRQGQSDRAEGHSNPGPETDRRLLEGHKLHMDRTAEAPQSQPAHRIEEDVDQTDACLADNNEVSKLSLLVQYPTPDRVDSHIKPDAQTPRPESVKTQADATLTTSTLSTSPQ